MKGICFRCGKEGELYTLSLPHLVKYTDYTKGPSLRKEAEDTIVINENDYMCPGCAETIVYAISNWRRP